MVLEITGHDKYGREYEVSFDDLLEDIDTSLRGRDITEADYNYYTQKLDAVRRMLAICARIHE